MVLNSSKKIANSYEERERVSPGVTPANPAITPLMAPVRGILRLRIYESMTQVIKAVQADIWVLKRASAAMLFALNALPPLKEYHPMFVQKK